MCYQDSRVTRIPSRVTRIPTRATSLRWLPFAIATVAVGADFIIMTSRVAGGIVDHVHQVCAFCVVFPLQCVRIAWHGWPLGLS